MIEKSWVAKRLTDLVLIQFAHGSGDLALGHVDESIVNGQLAALWGSSANVFQLYALQSKKSSGCGI